MGRWFRKLFKNHCVRLYSTHTHTHTHTPLVEPEFTALQSDLIQQVVAAVTQQQQVQQQCQEVVEEEGEGAREIVNPALLGIEVQ